MHTCPVSVSATSLPAIVWPVATTTGDLWRTNQDVLSHLQVSEAAAICFLTVGFYQAAFLFSWNVLSSSFSFCVHHTLFSICNEKKIEFVTGEIVF